MLLLADALFIAVKELRIIFQTATTKIADVATQF